MDYENLYKNALERAKKFIEENPLVQNLNTWIKETFPELCELEDEKVRKALIEMVHDTPNSECEQNYNVRKEDCLTWLENQGESYTKRDVDNAYIEGMASAKNELDKQSDSPIKWNKNTKDCKPKVSHSVLIKTTHGIAEGEWQGEHWHQYRWAALVRDADVLSWMELSDLEKQGEQKPIIEMKSAEESLGIDSETYNKIVDECIYGEQKPFDYENANIQQKDWAEIPFGTKDSELQEATYIIPEGFHAEIKGNEVFIKKGEQKSWSEEDETNLRQTEYAVMKFFGGDCSLVGWLRKSLKERYTWKPSDAQMASITCAVRKMKESACYDSELVSLLNDLRKLWTQRQRHIIPMATRS